MNVGIEFYKREAACFESLRNFADELDRLPEKPRRLHEWVFSKKLPWSCSECMLKPLAASLVNFIFIFLWKRWTIFPDSLGWVLMIVISHCPTKSELTTSEMATYLLSILVIAFSKAGSEGYSYKLQYHIRVPCEDTLMTFRISLEFQYENSSLIPFRIPFAFLSMFPTTGRNSCVFDRWLVPIQSKYTSPDHRFYDSVVAVSTTLFASCSNH